MAQASETVSGSLAGRRSARRGALAGAGLWLGAVWLACGGASKEGMESPLPSISLSSAGASNTPDAGSTTDAGACGGASCSECPPPNTKGDESLGPTTTWGRNPQTGTCCPYADQIDLPVLFPSFGSLEACQNSCRCAELEGVPGVPPEEQQDWVAELISLACYCSEKTCPTSLEAVVEERCGRGLTLHRSEGCGLRKLEQVREIGVDAAWIFDQATGALVGALDASDVPEFPCRSRGTRAGTDLDCPEVSRCRVCGELERDVGETIPACD